LDYTAYNLHFNLYSSAAIHILPSDSPLPPFYYYSFSEWQNEKDKWIEKRGQGRRVRDKTRDRMERGKA
jgi:hypothetical protein